MAGCGLARLITSDLARGLVLEVGKWRRAAVYPSADLTTAQALVLGLYHSLLEGDDAAAHLLLGAASGLPELASPSLAVWLRGDFRLPPAGLEEAVSRLAAFPGAAGGPLTKIFGAALLGRRPPQQEQCVEVRPRVRSVSTQTAIEAIDEVSAEPSACEVAPELLVASAAKSTKHQVLSAPPFPDQAPGETAVEASARATDENVPAFQGRRAAASGRSSTPATKGRRAAASGRSSTPATKGRRAAASGRSSTPATKGEAGRLLLRSAAAGNLAGVEAALGEGAAPAQRDGLGRTALHLAALHGQAATAQALLTAGAAPDAQDRLGRTPLHYTALKGHAALARLLLDGGADSGLRDASGMTPAALAAVRGRSELAALFKSRGGHQCCLC